MLKLNPDEHTWLNEYRDALNERHAGVVVRMVIYGSKARGDARSDSDLDVAHRRQERVRCPQANATRHRLRFGGNFLGRAVDSGLHAGRVQHRKEKGFPFQQAVERDAVAVL